MTMNQYIIEPPKNYTYGSMYLLMLIFFVFWALSLCRLLFGSASIGDVKTCVVMALIFLGIVLAFICFYLILTEFFLSKKFFFRDNILYYQSFALRKIVDVSETNKIVVEMDNPFLKKLNPVSDYLFFGRGLWAVYLISNSHHKFKVATSLRRDSAMSLCRFIECRMIEI